MSRQNRYDRQMKLPEIGVAGQEKLQKASILIVGVGGLGCPAAQYLTAAGVGRIGLLDHDQVDITNLHRQVLFSEKNVGQPKAEVAKAVLSKRNSDVSFDVHVKRLDETNAMDLLKDYDIILDGTDNFQTKYLINDACVLLDKPFVGASIYKYQGQLAVFNYQNGPTYRCLYPKHNFKDNNNCEDTGVLGVLPGVMGVMQATEALKMVLGIGNVLSGTLKLVDTLSSSDQLIRFKRNESQVGMVKNRPLQLEQITCELIDSNKMYLDVRELYEEPQAHQKGVLQIPLNQLKDRSEEIPTDQEVYVFCQSGIRSKKAINLLEKEFGFTNLVDVEGGIESIIK
ncbi:ThiF family adenylyltransferase [Ekhidna sp.]|uniref:ThiF family adenylyltransferase n=1 Tax=Ekhidna sp. TaxID=2608089 RepID=UPI003B593B07